MMMNSNYFIDNINNNKQHKPSDLITTMNNDPTTTINNELFLTQDPFASYLFGATTSDDMSSTPPMNDWLTTTGDSLLSLMPDFLKQENSNNNVMDYYLTEPSPALTSSSPVSSVGSTHDSPASATPPLFPDINNKKTGFRAIAPANTKKQPVPIMPKSLTPLLSLGAQHHQPISTPNKRKLHVDEKENDEIALKRQKNTDAARRSRLKKLVKMEALEARVVELETDNTKLSTRIAVLESEKSGLESKDKGLEDRIRTLEAQLAEAHKALTGRH
ncbi:hypothetical protein BC941DRAFT_437984 [Chlamydoabsidia padenii]|nr:hypothetical protein BC941DRAFT_437984 [Chlamydoabsidia padenii]